MAAKRRRRPIKRHPQGEPMELKIVDLAHDGRGVARNADGKTVFVWGALTGETVMAQCMKRSRGFDEAEVLEVLQASEHRVQPKCPHFGVCGGCTLQHLAAPAQISAKQAVLSDNFQRIGKVAPERWLPSLTAQSWGYRRRARIAVKNLPKKGRVLVGFRERDNPVVADMQQCHVLQQPIAELLQPLSEMIGKLSIKAKVPQIEVSVADDAIALVFRTLEQPNLADQAVMLQFGVEHNVDVYLQPNGPKSVYALAGQAKPLQIAIDAEHPQGAIKLDFQPLDFIQINGPLNQVMIDHALSLLDIKAHETVLDLFCGLGNFTLPLARRAKQVVGVEGDEGLVERARANAKANNLSNVEFAMANLFEEQSQAPWLRGKRYDAVLLDPARAGAQEILPLLPATGAKRVLYISCHPGTLSRDAGILVNELGYQLKAAGVMDMFPHTAHVESIALFEHPGLK